MKPKTTTMKLIHSFKVIQPLGSPVYNISVIEQTFLVDIDNIPTDLLYDANPRLPLKTSVAYKAMRKTLREEPLFFLERNNGIVYSCQDFFYNEETLTLLVAVETDKQMGIINGGHTYAALKDAYQAGEGVGASFKLSLKKGIPAERLTGICEGLNKHKGLRLNSVFVLKNSYEPIAKNIPTDWQKRLLVKEGGEGRFHDRARLTAWHLGRLLALFLRYDSAKDDEPFTNLAKNKTSSRIEPAIKNLSHLSRDVVLLEKAVFDYITKHYINRQRSKIVFFDDIEGFTDGETMMLDGSVYPFSVPSIFTMPILAPFKFCLNSQSNQWKVHPLEIWGQVSQEVTELVIAELRKAKKKKRGYENVLTDKELWQKVQSVVRSQIEIAIDSSVLDRKRA